jgi:hypothetical protein
MAPIAANAMKNNPVTSSHNVCSTREKDRNVVCAALKPALTKRLLPNARPLIRPKARATKPEAPELDEDPEEGAAPTRVVPSPPTPRF